MPYDGVIVVLLSHFYSISYTEAYIQIHLYIGFIENVFSTKKLSGTKRAEREKPS